VEVSCVGHRGQSCRCIAWTGYGGRVVACACGHAPRLTDRITCVRATVRLKNVAWQKGHWLLSTYGLAGCVEWV
jgi:hypothetical protein